jgi:hypothetical protein
VGEAYPSRGLRRFRAASLTASAKALAEVVSNYNQRLPVFELVVEGTSLPRSSGMAAGRRSGTREPGSWPERSNAHMRRRLPPSVSLDENGAGVRAMCFPTLPRFSGPIKLASDIVSRLA